MKWKLGRLRAVISTSPAYANTSPTLADVANLNRLHVIPLGIDEHSYPQSDLDDALLKRFGLDDGEPFFLFIGVLRYYKGLHFLVQAAAAVNARIIVVGSGPEFTPLRSAVQNQSLRNFIFAGQVSDQEKTILLKHCFAFVLPSHLRSEAFGMVLVEASMFGKPMVSCEIGTGTSFINVNGETGFVVPPESPRALADSMNALLNDKIMTERFGRAARKRYEALFSGPALGRAHARLYRGILSG
jgi:rhamnosyl/mannosyltransferase